MTRIAKFPDRPQPKDVWPFSLEFTASLAMPVLFWAGVLVGYLIALDGVR